MDKQRGLGLGGLGMRVINLALNGTKGMIIRGGIQERKGNKGTSAGIIMLESLSVYVCACVHCAD